jgi:hypothetical protein
MDTALDNHPDNVQITVLKDQRLNLAFDPLARRALWYLRYPLGDAGKLIRVNPERGRDSGGIHQLFINAWCQCVTGS